MIAPRTWWSSKKNRETVGKWICLIIALSGACFFILPFAWMLSTSFKETRNVFIYPPQWIPRPFVWGNFAKAWTSAPFNLFLRNTVLITTLCLIGVLLSNPLVAYGFARIEFPGRNILFVILLATMMIPYPVTLIPLFILYRNFGWIDTFKPLIVPYFFGNAFFIFLLRQLFLSIPKDLEDAARIDGCSTAGIYWRIFLPLSKPGLATVAIFTFMGTWNDFLGPLIFLNSQEKFTLQLGLQFFQGQYWVKTQFMMAIATLIILPCLIVFFLAQKSFVQGIILTGLKG